jgi:hypothetical protein
VFTLVSRLGSVRLSHAHGIAVNKATRQKVRDRLFVFVKANESVSETTKRYNANVVLSSLATYDKTPMRMGWKAFWEKGSLEESQGIPRCKAVAMMNQHDKGGRFRVLKKVGADAAGNRIL